MKKIRKKVLWGFYIVASVIITVFTGCSALMPTRKPMLTDELGYNVPNYRNWTTIGINEMAYRIEVEKLKVWKVMIGLVNDPALQLHTQIVNWWAMAASGGALGGIPLALRKVPKGAISREEHEKAIAEAAKKA